MTLRAGLPRRVVGFVLVVGGLVFAASGDPVPSGSRLRLGVCLLVALMGAAMMSLTDRLKLDFVKKRYLRVYGWAPFVHFRGGSFDDLEGISIHHMARGAGEAVGKVSLVVFLNWEHHDLPPFELATYSETRMYCSDEGRLVTLSKAKPEDLVSGTVAAERRAEQFRERFGFHRLST
ncbi:MAG TPA: hypothetical protein VKT78_20665 [Fimbriimonadaceae bacterium]|nr:hypothetical protein [Fimbriimonadaceae bacterium]